jgi:HAD superfamily hydrolase (TIGR01662 family)
MKEAVLIIGYPGAGKSTQTEKYLLKGYDRLNRDLLGGSVADLLPRFEALIKHKSRGVVLDNLFTTVASRKPFIDLANKYRIPVNCVWVDTSIEDAQLNVCMRMLNKHGKLLSPEEISQSKDPGDLPPAVLFNYRKEFQRPTKAEGFANIEVAHFERQLDPSYVNKALIVDKDGTLTECASGAKFPCTVEDIRAIQGRGEILREFQDAGYKLLGVSNQSGVAKGQLTEARLQEILRETNRLLGVDIEWAYCPHSIPPIRCWCRKPMTGHGAQFIYRYKLRPSDCLMVGDSKSDQTFAERCGFKFINHDLFFTGKVKP